jgi:hypothetical protein
MGENIAMRYRLSPSPNVSARSFGDEVIAANFRAGVYYSLLGSAAQIWEGLMAGLPLDRVVSAVAVYIDADAKDVAEASRRLVEGLLAEQLIVPGESEPERDWKPAAPAEGRYELPMFERFTDMQDLLLLDPVHDVEDMGWPHAATDRPA